MVIKCLVMCFSFFLIYSIILVCLLMSVMSYMTLEFKDTFMQLEKKEKYISVIISGGTNLFCVV